MYEELYQLFLTNKKEFISRINGNLKNINELCFYFLTHNDLEKLFVLLNDNIFIARNFIEELLNIEGRINFDICNYYLKRIIPYFKNQKVPREGLERIYLGIIKFKRYEFYHYLDKFFDKRFLTNLKFIIFLLKEINEETFLTLKERIKCDSIIFQEMVKEKIRPELIKYFLPEKLVNMNSFIKYLFSDYYPRTFIEINPIEKYKNDKIFLNNILFQTLIEKKVTIFKNIKDKFSSNEFYSCLANYYEKGKAFLIETDVFSLDQSKILSLFKSSGNLNFLSFINVVEKRDIMNFRIDLITIISFYYFNDLSLIFPDIVEYLKEKKRYILEIAYKINKFKYLEKLLRYEILTIEDYKTIANNNANYIIRKKNNDKQFLRFLDFWRKNNINIELNISKNVNISVETLLYFYDSIDSNLYLRFKKNNFLAYLLHIKIIPPQEFNERLFLLFYLIEHDRFEEILFLLEHSRDDESIKRNANIILSKFIKKNNFFLVRNLYENYLSKREDFDFKKWLDNNYPFFSDYII